MPSGLSPGAVDAEGGVKLSSVSVAVSIPANDAKGAPDVKVQIAGVDHAKALPTSSRTARTSTGAPIARFPERRNAR